MGIARITPNGDFISQSTNINDIKVLLVPSVHCSFFYTQLPVKSIAQAQKIVPFALEEELSEDIENLHFSVQYQKPNWLVVVCSDDKMSEWLSIAQENSCSPKKVIPDILALSNNISILFEPDQVLILREDEVPFAVSEKIADDHFFSAFNVDVEQVEVFRSSNYSDLLETELKISNQTINLIQGKYSSTTHITNWLSPWLRVALLALFIWAGYLVSIFIENKELEEQIKVARIDNITRLKTTFPDIQRIVNARTQAQQKFDEMQKKQKLQSSSLIYLLNYISQVAEKNNTVAIQSVRFRNYTLQLQVTAKTVAVVEDFIKQLKQESSFEVKVESLNQDSGISKSTINIKKIA